MAYTPDRGDLIWINFNPQVGHEQAGRRPALVLSPQTYNSRIGLAIVCPVTNQVKGYPMEVRIPEGLDVTGVILADQVKSLAWRGRNAVFICQLPRPVVQEAVNKLQALIK
jgi:mRNA interferase MazF